MSLFGEIFRGVRDGDLTGQDSWKFRHGDAFMGHTFHLWSIKPLDEIEVEDLKWFLLQAVQDPQATDLQMYFKKPWKENPNEKLNQAAFELTEDGFVPMNITSKISGDGIGWIRMALYSQEDLPSTPEISSFGEPH